VRRRARILRARAGAWVLGRLIRSRRLSALLRRLRPVARIGGRLWVTRHDDVVDVLRRDRDFGVPYLRPMQSLGAPFILGLDDGPEYRRQARALRCALRPEDLAAISRASGRAAEHVLERAGGSVEAVGGLADRVLAETAGPYLGTGPGDARRVEQARDVFAEVFLNGLGDPVVRERAQASARELREQVERALAARRDALGGDVPDDVAGRLLALERDGAADRLVGRELADNLLGLLVAWTTSVSRTTAFALDALLDRPDAVAAAGAAARAGDEPRVAALAFEALRFQPAAPAVERVCTRRARIAGRTVERGTPVLALLSSAMMDERRIARPRAFDPDRAAPAGLHFGHGLHACLGRDISRVQIGAIATALLRRDGVRRTGRLRMRGPYPRELQVAFLEG
jgi:cytochrome P450